MQAVMNSQVPYNVGKVIGQLNNCHLLKNNNVDWLIKMQHRVVWLIKMQHRVDWLIKMQHRVSWYRHFGVSRGLLYEMILLKCLIYIQLLFTRLQALKKLAHPRGQAGTRSQDSGCVQTNLTADFPTATENPNFVTCAEECKSDITAITWLDDVRDLEDMDNRMNEALEVKMTSLER